MTINNRWTILAAGCLIQTVFGGVYAWSTFVPYLNQGYALSIGKCGFIFGATILIFTSAMILAGRVLAKKGPRFTASLAAGLFMTGYLAASFSGGSFALLLLSLGGIVGCGIGFGYVCPLSLGMKWFPEKKGLVTGVAVAGFGAGAVLLSSIAEYFLTNGADVLTFFRWFGITSGIILFAAALFLSEPPTEKVESSTAPHDRSAFLTWPFLLNVIGIFSGTFAGLLIIGNLKPIVLDVGLTAKQAAIAVSVFAVGNGLGRIAWGKLFDLFHYKCIPFLLSSFAVAIGALLIPLSSWLVMFVIGLIGFYYGANFVLYASAISRFFGTASFPRLYPVCFITYGFAGIIGPGIGGFIADHTGSYDIPIYLCIAIVTLAAILTYLKLPILNQQPST